ncbi:DUF6044 family protein [Bacillus piscicola]|uniref:DUF6044 family protein n=1 Tax=Bacillus piscicola TaxID=1632684 RepID=UPI001F093C84|nr:DUF6044 family protein [Bacillus piscicola]
MNKERLLLGISVLAILAYVSPFFFLGEDVHVRIHDHLDSNVIWYKTLIESGKTFAPSSAEIAVMMNGLPRGSLDTQFSLYVLLFYLFKPLTVLTINELFMRFIAFFGMYVFLTSYVLKKETTSSIVIAAGSALAFSLLPFWPFGGASIAGIPLALYAFLNIRGRKSSWKDWLIISLLPFYSSFVLSFIFFLGLMGVLWLVDWIRSKRANWCFFFSIAWMSALFLVKQYRLVTGVLLEQGFTDHRVEFSRGYNTFSRTLGLFQENFLTAHTHSYSLHDTIIIYVVLVALLLLVVGKLTRKIFTGEALAYSKQEKALPLLLLLAALFSFWYALWYWEGFRVLKNTIEITNTFNFGRFHLLNAVIWYILFALALTVINRTVKRSIWLIALLIAGQLFVVSYENFEWKYARAGMPTYGEFYAEEQFAEIRDYIGRPPEDYRIVSIGMYPAVAHFNGFYSLDMYVTMYPLSYKHQFREIIEGELAKNEKMENYYDTWGSRVYVFTDELGKEYLYTKDKHASVEDLDFGTEAFKKMGGDYVLSAVEIKNAADNNLKLLQVFENDNSAWRIYLYEAE